MDNTKIHIKHFGSFGNYYSNWTDPELYKELGLIPNNIYPTKKYPTKAHPRTFEIVNEKLFNYAIIKYEIQHESITEYRRNLMAKQLKP
jgi:hypothetical protein